jgi:uncharacterized cupin superfamily protein
MSYTKLNYEEVDPVGDAMHFLRDPLGCERMGITVLTPEPGWIGTEHDHADEGQEEVYLLVEGEATLVIEGEELPMKAGDAVRIAPETTRQIRNGDVESTFVLAGAP